MHRVGQHNCITGPIFLLPFLKRAAKLLLMTNSQSHYFTSFSSNFFENLIFSLLYLPKAYPQNFSDISTKLTFLEVKAKSFPSLEIFLPLKLKKGVQLDNSKKGCTSLPSGLCVGHPWFILDWLCYAMFRNCLREKC